MHVIVLNRMCSSCVPNFQYPNFFISENELHRSLLPFLKISDLEYGNACLWPISKPLWYLQQSRQTESSGDKECGFVSCTIYNSNTPSSTQRHPQYCIWYLMITAARTTQRDFFLYIRLRWREIESSCHQSPVSLLSERRGRLDEYTSCLWKWIHLFTKSLLVPANID